MKLTQCEGAQDGCLRGKSRWTAATGHPTLAFFEVKRAEYTCFYLAGDRFHLVRKGFFSGAGCKCGFDTNPGQYA